jgi:TolA-binding protein|tara:strand:+ start:405 stop:731 length:327 start_codon:yes stop_codon:yes gene_type:complete
VDEIIKPLLEYGILGLWTVSLIWQGKQAQGRFDAEIKRHEEDKSAMRKILTMHSEQLNKIEDNLASLIGKVEIMVRDSQEARMREAMRAQNKTKYVQVPVTNKKEEDK